MDDDDDDDFPPAVYPVREAITMGLFALMILALLVWVGEWLIGFF